MTSDNSHASRRCPWRFYTRFHSDKSNPMQPSRWAFEGVRTLPRVEKLMPVHPSERQGNTVRTLFTVPEDSSFPLLMRKGITAVTVWTLGQHVRTRSWYRKLSALFWKGSCNWPSGRSIKPSGRPSMSGGFWTRLSIFIITFCSSIGIRQNWCRWKANKKLYNLKIWKANRNVQTERSSIRTACQNSRSFRIPF